MAGAFALGMDALRTQLQQRKETLWKRVRIFFRHNVDGGAILVCELFMVYAMNGMCDSEIVMLLGSFVLVGFVCE